MQSMSAESFWKIVQEQTLETERIQEKAQDPAMSLG